MRLHGMRRLRRSIRQGWERFGRELLSMLISPMSGLHRICSGEAWKTGSYRGDAAVAGNTPVRFYVGAGRRAPAEDSEIKSSIGNAVSLDLKLRYGNLFSEENEKPYDAFRMGARNRLFILK